MVRQNDGRARGTVFDKRERGSFVQRARDCEQCGNGTEEDRKAKFHRWRQNHHEVILLGVINVGGEASASGEDSRLGEVRSWFPSGSLTATVGP